MALSHLTKTIKNFVNSAFYPWKWVQIEPTSFCNCNCTYCPQSSYSNFWKNGLMDFSLYTKLLDEISWIKMVYLQGWGEPFVHPKLIEMIVEAKNKGFAVGTTTNGMLLNGDTCKKVVESGLDVIAFSLAGFQKNNDKLRKGTKYNNILKSIETILKEREVRGLSYPKVHIAYMWLRGFEEDLYSVAKDLLNLNIDQLVISTLTFIPEKGLENFILTWNDKIQEEAKKVDSLLSSVSTKVSFQLIGDNLSKTCLEDVFSTCFVSYMGNVAPCVFSQIPVVGDKVFFYFKGEPILYEPWYFGNLHLNTFKEIWNKRDYKSFRKNFTKISFCKKCYKRLSVKVNLSWKVPEFFPK